MTPSQRYTHHCQEARVNDPWAHDTRICPSPDCPGCYAAAYVVRQGAVPDLSVNERLDKWLSTHDERTASDRTCEHCGKVEETEQGDSLLCRKCGKWFGHDERTEDTESGKPLSNGSGFYTEEE